jgi:signal transduction histidine kinase
MQLPREAPTSLLTDPRSWPRRAGPLAALVGGSGLAALTVTLAFQHRLSFQSFVVLQVLLITAWVVGGEARVRRAFAAMVADRAARLERELAYMARETVLAEGVRAARELHELVTGDVEFMVSQLKGVEQRLPAGPGPGSAQLREAREALGRIVRSAERTVTRLQHGQELLDLNGPGDRPSQPGPVSQLGALVTEVKTAGLPVDVVVEGAAVPLPAEVDGSAYRIVQEALSNCLKRPGPARPQLLIRYGPQDLELQVTEDAAAWHLDPDAGRHANLGWVQPRSPAADPGAEPLLEGGYGVHARLPLAASPRA